MRPISIYSPSTILHFLAILAETLRVDRGYKYLKSFGFVSARITRKPLLGPVTPEAAGSSPVHPANFIDVFLPFHCLRPFAPGGRDETAEILLDFRP
jgi:hypothetical protein